MQNKQIGRKALSLSLACLLMLGSFPEAGLARKGRRPVKNTYRVEKQKKQRAITLYAKKKKAISLFPKEEKQGTKQAGQVSPQAPKAVSAPRLLESRAMGYRQTSPILQTIPGTIPTALPADEGGLPPGAGARAIEPADWTITKENQKEKNYWPLTQEQYLKRVSGVAEPLKSPNIIYNGYFTRPDGRTVIRLSFRKYDTVATGVWYLMFLKFDHELANLIDFGNPQTGVYSDISNPSGTGWKNDDTKYKKVTNFGSENFETAGSNDVYSINLKENLNRGSAKASNEIPINLVLKDGKSMGDVNKLGQSLIQMRLLSQDKTAIYTDGNADLGDSKQSYNTYTFSTTVGAKDGYDKGLYRYLNPNTPHFHSGNSTIHYNLEQGFVEVRHHFTREARAGKLEGHYVGYRQVVDKSFYDILASRNGTVGYMYQMWSNGSSNGAFRDDGTLARPDLVVPIQEKDLNKEGDWGFIQVVENDFNTKKEYDNKVKSIKTTNKMADIFSETNPSTLNYGHAIVFRYYVDKNKLAARFSGNNLSHSAFYSTFIYDNSEEGTDKYEFTLPKDVKLEAGKKIILSYSKDRPGKQNVMMYVDGPGNKMELRSNFANTTGNKLTYTLQEGMPLDLKVGTKITLIGYGTSDKDIGKSNVALSFEGNNDQPIVAYKQKSYVPIIPDWQDTLSAGTLASTDFKPEIDEIFTDDEAIEGSSYYIGAQIKMIDKNHGIQLFEASRDKKRVKVGDKEYDGYRFKTPLPSDRFKFPILEKDAPILFTNRDVEHWALESKPEVVEQVQAKVNFHHQNATANKYEDITEKIVPLNNEYSYNQRYDDTKKEFIFTKNNQYKPNGFLGYKEGNDVKDNLKKVEVQDGQNKKMVLADHNGRALQGEALKKRQMPITDDKDESKIEVTNGDKRFLGWSTKPNTDPQEFMKAEELTSADDWKEVDNGKVYKFTEYSPVDKHRDVYAVWGDLSVILHHPSGDDSKNIVLPITKKNIVNDGSETYALVDIPEVFYSHKNSPDNANMEFAYRYDNGQPNKYTHFLGWQLAGKDGKPVIDKVKNGEHLGNDFINKGIFNLKDLMDNPATTDKNEQETVYMPNCFKLKIDGDLAALKGQENIDLYPIYRDYAKIRLYKTYKKLDTAGNYQDFEESDAVKKHPVKFGLLYRTYVSSYDDPTVANAANYYTLREDDFNLTEDTMLPSFNPNDPVKVDKVKTYNSDGTFKEEKEYKYQVSWNLPVFDKYGERISYAAVEVKPGDEDSYKHFSQKWENLSVNVYTRLPGAGNQLVAEGPAGPENDGKGLSKTQTVSFDRGSDVDTFTAATYRDTVSGATPQGHAKDKFQGYQIRVYNTLTPISTPEIDPVHEGDEKLVINYKNKTVDKIVLKIGQYDTTKTETKIGYIQKDTPKDNAKTVELIKDSGAWKVNQSDYPNLTVSYDDATKKITVKGFKTTLGQEDLKKTATSNEKVFGMNFNRASNLKSDWSGFPINPRVPAQYVVDFDQVERDENYNTRITMKVPKLEAGPLNEPQSYNAEYQLLRLIEEGMTPIDSTKVFQEDGKQYEKIGTPVPFENSESLTFTIPKNLTGDETVVHDPKDFNNRDEEGSKIKETDKFYIQSIETAKPTSISKKYINLDLTGAKVTAGTQQDVFRMFVNLIATDLDEKDAQSSNKQDVYFVINGKVEQKTTKEDFVNSAQYLENNKSLDIANTRIVVFDRLGNKTSVIPAFTKTKVISVEAERPLEGDQKTAVKADKGTRAYVTVYDIDDKPVAKGEADMTGDFVLIDLYQVDGQGAMDTSKPYKLNIYDVIVYKSVKSETEFSNELTFVIE